MDGPAEMSAATMLLLTGVPLSSAYGTRKPPQRDQGPGCGWFVFLLLIVLVVPDVTWEW